jgi:antitoxin component of MazEF toxin-antitoxin module
MLSLTMQRYKTLRKIANYSLFITIPPEAVRAFDLNAGDQVLLDIGKEEIRMKFFKATMNKMEQETVEAAVEPKKGPPEGYTNFKNFCALHNVSERVLKLAIKHASLPVKMFGTSNLINVQDALAAVENVQKLREEQNSRKWSSRKWRLEENVESPKPSSAPAESTEAEAVR